MLNFCLLKNKEGVMDVKCFFVFSIVCVLLVVVIMVVVEDIILDWYFYLGGYIGQSWLDIGDYYEGDGYFVDNVFENDIVILFGVQIGYCFSENWFVQVWYECNNMFISDGEVYLCNNFVSLCCYFNGDGLIEFYVGLGVGEICIEFDVESDCDFKEIIGGLEFGV